MSMRVKVQYTTTERLLAVADIVEANDGRWAQGSWAHKADAPVDGEYLPPDETIANVITTHSCGSYGCIAGWSVAMVPKRQANQIIDVLEDAWGNSWDWDEIGALALGLQDERTGSWLFSGALGVGMDAAIRSARVAEILRYLATVPEGERNEDQIPNLELILAGKKPKKVKA